MKYRMPYPLWSWTRKSIKYFLLSDLLIMSSCHQSSPISESPGADIPEPAQVTFVRSLKTKGLIDSNVDSSLNNKIFALCSRSRFGRKININNDIDSSSINFFLLNSDADTTMRQLCAYIGYNIILLDKKFLTHFLDKYISLHRFSKEQLAHMYSSFQSWVIGHEIAHADLKHMMSHFISFNKPKDSRQGFVFHSLEIAADEKSLDYCDELHPELRDQLLVRIFQADYDSVYKPDSNCTNKYLKYYDEFGLQRPYVFRGIGSHPLMMYRSALLLLLSSKNETIKNEAYTFLIEINAFAEVRKWKPSERRNIKIKAFSGSD